MGQAVFVRKCRNRATGEECHIAVGFLENDALQAVFQVIGEPFDWNTRPETTSVRGGQRNAMREKAQARG